MQRIGNDTKNPDLIIPDQKFPHQNPELWILPSRDISIKYPTFELTTPKGQKILLTPVQYDLLFHFMTHPGEIFSPTRLLDEIWDYPSDAGSPDLVRVHIKNLRMRVEEDPSTPVFIETIPGYGYTVRKS